MPGQNFTGTREMYHRWHRSRRFHVIVRRYRDDFRLSRVRDYRDGAVRCAQIDATNAARNRIVVVGYDESLISSSAVQCCGLSTRARRRAAMLTMMMQYWQYRR